MTQQLIALDQRLELQTGFIEPLVQDHTLTQYLGQQDLLEQGHLEALVQDQPTTTYSPI